MGWVARRLLLGVGVAVVVLALWHRGLFHRLHLIAMDLGLQLRRPPSVAVVRGDETGQAEKAKGAPSLPDKSGPKSAPGANAEATVPAHGGGIEGFRFVLHPGPPPHRSGVVIIGIEEDSLAELGSLPWSRRNYARVIDLLREAGARVIAFDLWLEGASPDATDDAALREAVSKHGNVFFARYCERDQANVLVKVKPPYSHKELFGTAVREAHINVEPDPDGKLRTLPCEIGPRSERFLAMPIAVVAAGENIPLRAEEVIGPLAVAVGYTGLVQGMLLGVADSRHMAPLLVLGVAQRGMVWRRGGILHVGQRRIPLVRDSRRQHAFLLDLPAEDQSSYRPFDYTFRQILAGKFDPEVIRNKIVYIGWISQGRPEVERRDVYVTPRGTKYGVILLAETTQQILSSRFLVPAPGTATVALVVGLGLITPLFFSLRRLAASLVAFVLLLVLVLTVFGVLVAHRGYILEPVPLLASLLGALVGGLVLSLWETRHELIRDAKAMEILREVGEIVATSTGMANLVTGRRPDVSDSFLLPAQTPQVLLESMGQAVGATRGALYLWRHDRSKLERVAVFGNPDDVVPPGMARRINERVLRERAPFASSAPARDLGRYASTPLRNLLAMPLTVKGHVFGVVHLFDKHPTEVSPGRHFAPADLRLAATMVQQMMVGLENARLYEGMRGIFLSATLALANAVDAKDPYTHGHSDRVLRYSEKIARAMQLSERDVEITKLSAVLHDIGKIAIPDEILRKPGKLTRAEYEIMKTHPARGEAILAPLEELRPLAPGIRHHHEWYNGGGYPDGLRGTDIPLYGRIICVADAYDAITSARFYRPARTPKEAAEEIERCAGSQFDPEVAARMIEIITASPPEEV